MDNTDQSIAAALAAEHGALDARLSSLTPGDWLRQSRCTEWNVADVVLHLAQTDELAIASFEGRFAEESAQQLAGLPEARDVDESVGLIVERERGAPAAEVFARWRANVARLADLASGELPRRVRWVAGEMAAPSLVTTRIAETWIHSDDIAWAFGPPPVPTDRLWFITRLAWRTVPYAFLRAGRSLTGPVAFELASPTGEPWVFHHDEPAATIVRGSAHELCLVAGQRAHASDTALTAEGPDAAAVLELVRTYA
jgi:uncharacterized protein (TIGR03084 family)